MGSLIKNSSDVVCILAPDTRVHYVSPSLEQMFAHDARRADRPRAGRDRPPRRGPAAARLIAAIAAAGRRPALDRRVPRQPRRGRGLARRRGARHEPAGRRVDRGDRAEHARRQRAQGVRGRARAPGLPRHAHRPAQPGAVPQPRRARARQPAPRPPAAWRCCSSTSTTSSSSTTASATRRATSCCRRSAGAWRTACARSTPPRASAATSSRS